mgnify:CR=1 FL=1
MSDIPRSYQRVVLVWITVLVALYLFERYFS